MLELRIHTVKKNRSELALAQASGIIRSGNDYSGFDDMSVSIDIRHYKYLSRSRRCVSWDYLFCYLALTRIQIIGMSGTPDYLNLIWSKVEHKLGDFVSKFPLPQIVRVEEGYYGPSEDSCLGSEQILTLHAVRSTEKVRAKDHRNRDLHIPLNCSQRVELRPQNLKELYEHVSELSSVFPRFVRVVQGYYNLENEDQCISPGDKLELKKIKRGDVEDYLEFENQERIKVRLPMSVSAGFQPLVDGREYYLKELASSMKMPVLFQFVDSQMDIRGVSNVFSSTLGVLKFLEVYRDETIICTTKESNTRYVVTVPKNLDVTVTVAEGALVGDKDYVRICHSLHDGVSLSKIENLELENLYASRKQIRGYRQLQIPSAPPVPPRNVDSMTTKCQDVATNDDALNDTTSSERSSDMEEQKVKEALTNGSASSSPSTSKKGSHEVQKSHTDHNTDHVYEYISEGELESLRKLKPGWKKVGQSGVMLGTSGSLDKIAAQQHTIASNELETPNLHETGQSSDYVAVDPDNVFPLETNSNAKQEILGIPDTSNVNSVEKLVSQQDQEPLQPANVLSCLPKLEAQSERTPRKFRPPVKPKAVAPSIPPRPDAEARKLSTGNTSNTKVKEQVTENFCDLSVLTVKEVSEFLQKYHLNEFVQVFYDNDIDGEMLISLDDETLKALGMNAFQSKKLLKMIGGWRPKT